MVVDHHDHLVLRDHHVHRHAHYNLHHNPHPHIHLQFVVDLDNSYLDTVAYKDQPFHTVAVVDNHRNKVYHHNHHHHRHHVLTIHHHLLRDQLKNKFRFINFYK